MSSYSRPVGASGVSDWTNHGRDRQPRVNLAILPEKLAAAFHRFCQLNPKPCPIIGISEVGNPH
jgi:uncharacterized protein YcsI (UPF0317 family)